MTITGLLVRPADEADAELLSTFACSSGPTYESEVEEFVRKGLLEWALAPGAAVDDPRALLLLDELDTNTLVAVAAHEQLTELVVRGQRLEGTKAQVVAVALTSRGTQIAGRRPGDLAFEALRHDARTRHPPRGRALAAVVAETNAPSLAMCDRQGLAVTVRRSPGYVWRVGRI
jgi:hypothetical protein